jgi:hypothetical protein
MLCNMPTQEPNSKMDELLRAYAKKRREQAGPVAEMHPFTRTLLQQEVKRTFAASPTAAAGRSWRAWRWPLLAMWGAMAALLVMFAFINAQLKSLAPDTASVETVKKKEEKIDALARNPLPGAAKRMTNLAARDASAPQRFRSAAVPAAPGGVPPAAPAGAAGLGVTVENRLAPAAVSAKAISPIPMMATTAANDGADVAAADFVQVRQGATALPLSNLLSNFRLNRAGQKVSVVDADGSVYNGQVLDVTSRKGVLGGGAGGGAQQSARAPKDAIEDANWPFEVSGFNNSLKQNITFFGNVLDMPMTNFTSNAAAQNRNAALFQNTSNASQAPGAQNSRITGQVQVGGGKPYQIEAKPPAP